MKKIILSKYEHFVICLLFSFAFKSVKLSLSNSENILLSWVTLIPLNLELYWIITHSTCLDKCGMWYAIFSLMEQSH
jgi:hypothetical protein